MTARPERPLPRWSALLCIAVLAAACGEDPTAGGPVCADQRVLTLGTPEEGVLRSGDARFAGAFIDYWALQLDEPAEVTLRMSSTEIDPLLLVFDRDGDVVAQAFQSTEPGPGVPETPSLVRAFGAGCNLIGASAYEVGDEGAYTLSVELAP